MKISDLRRESSAALRRNRGQAGVKPTLESGKAEVRSFFGAGDLTLAQLGKLLARQNVSISHRQLQNWAEDGGIPGAYRQKRGRGHWRVRVCDTLVVWLQYFELRDRLRIKSEAQLFQLGMNAIKDATDLDERALIELATVRNPDDYERLIQRAMREALGEMTGGSKVDADGWMTYDPFAPRPAYHLPASKARDLRRNADGIKVKLMVRDLETKGTPSRGVVRSICEALKISRATFYRRGYGRLLQNLSSTEVLRKDERARKLHADQVLEETKHDDD